MFLSNKYIYGSLVTFTLLLEATLKLFGSTLSLWILFPLLSIILIYSKSGWKYSLGLPIISAYLLLISAGSISMSVKWIFYPIPEAQSLETNLVGIIVGIIGLIIGVGLYQKQLWSIYATKIFVLLFLLSAVIEGFRIWNQTSSVMAYLNYSWFGFIIGIVVLLYLIAFNIKWKNLA
jgi:hypothetical protein